MEDEDINANHVADYNQNIFHTRDVTQNGLNGDILHSALTEAQNASHVALLL